MNNERESVPGVNTLLRNLNGLPIASGKMVSRFKVDRPRLINFLRSVQELDSVVTAARPMPMDERIEGFDEALDSINQCLKQYELVPRLSPRLEEDHIKWRLLWYNQQSIHLDFLNIDTILDLAQQGRVSALKQCANCEQWLFARFSHQRFCSDSCKETFHRTNPEDKVRRREWAKKNYWLHKTKNVK